mmetsp:Transcript_22959/g.46498  ORF Transcript_22959/g.46498 Transcript_22959/m.46498 type:complete len:424 (+) Transcript_22959:75-1346(+)
MCKGGMCTTSPDAYDLAVKLCDEYTRRKQKEKDLNKRKEETKKKAEAKDGEGISRKVTDIDYGKHENTVKELARQEKEEEYARKKIEAAQWCTLDHEHGPNCRRPVGGCSHDHQKEWAIYEKSTEEKIAAADRFRQEGNEAYKKQNFGLASVHYRKALLQFDYTFAENDEEEKAVENVKVPCLLNLAACKCQQEEWDEVLTQCRLALEINPRSVKAFYRTAQAHLARDQFDLAKDALMSAYEIEPQNAEVRAAYVQLKKNMANYKARRKEVFKEMMSADPVAEAGADAAANAGTEAPEPAQTPEAAGGVDDSTTKSGEAPPVDAAEGTAANLVKAQDQQDHAEVLSSEVEQDAEPATLRQRRGAQPSDGSALHKSQDPAEDDDDKEEEAVALPPKVLNAILLIAILLGVISVLVGVLVYSYGG